MTIVAGVDGCRSGWVVVTSDASRPSSARVAMHASFEEVLAGIAAGTIAVDIPIGLPEMGGIGGRRCDADARAGLGARQSAVFAVPSRAAVMAEDYREACAVALRTSNPPRKVSKQCFNLFARIREVDRLMTPALQERVRECHPEAAFVAMNGGRPLGEPKKVKSRPYEPGLALRRRLLEAAGFDCGFLLADPPRGAGPDDVLDACACCWTAARIMTGEARTFPADPPRDARGLRMEICA
jgi:predicted RNase H-like nuclease